MSETALPLELTLGIGLAFGYVFGSTDWPLWVTFAGSIGVGAFVAFLNGFVKAFRRTRAEA